MQSAKRIDDSGDKGVPIRDTSLSHERQDSETSIEAAHDEAETRRLTRKLLRKLDTR
jgi:hypothetical protein